MEKLRRKLRRLRRLNGRGWQILLITFALLTVMRLGLLILPFRVLLKWVEHLSQRSRVVTNLPVLTLGDLIWAVNCSSRYMPGGAKCLARALTTKVIMHHQGYVPELKIGVAKSNQGGLEAHAWVEYEGCIVIGNLIDLPRYMPLPSLEGIQL
jgi:hypothetical protein